MAIINKFINNLQLSTSNNNNIILMIITVVAKPDVTSPTLIMIVPINNVIRIPTRSKIICTNGVTTSETK